MSFLQVKTVWRPFAAPLIRPDEPLMSVGGLLGFGLVEMAMNIWDI